MENFSEINKTKIALPRISFAVIKNDILGREYSLSIAFVSKNFSAELNKKYRGKDGPTNILSFPLDKDCGEIILCPAVAKTESKNFDRTFRQFLGFLVIHGMLHLKGMDHGAIMERSEKKYDTKYFGRRGHRDLYDESCSGGISKRVRKS